MRSTATHVQSHRFHSQACMRAARRMRVLPVALMILCAAMLGWRPATVSAHASASGPAHAVLVDSPAVARIVASVDATLTCLQCAANGADIISPASGSFSYATSGSGAFISSDGYLLTADHVVDHSVNNPEEVSLIQQTAAQDIAQRYNQTSDAILAFFQKYPSQVRIAFHVTSQQVFLSTAYTGTLASPNQAVAYPVIAVVASSPVLEEDTAIIKVAAQNMPYLTLAAPDSITVGEQVTAIAFPADADLALNTADFTALFDPAQSDANTINSLLGPSVNTGQITKQTIRSDGAVILETTDISSQGSSGGPVVDDAGQIVGFVDAGPQTDRLSFLISSRVIVLYARQAGISPPHPGAFMPLWSRATTEYDGSFFCHWTNAAHDLQTLHQQYPGFGGVSTYLSKAQQSAAREVCQTSTSSQPSAGIFALLGGALLLIILVALVIVFVRSRQKPAPALAGYPATVPMGAQPSANYTMAGAGAPPYAGTAPQPPQFAPDAQPMYPDPRYQQSAPSAYEPPAPARPNPPLPRPAAGFYPNTLGAANAQPPAQAYGAPVYPSQQPQQPQQPYPPMSPPQQPAPPYGAGAPYDQQNAADQMGMRAAPTVRPRRCYNGHIVTQSTLTNCPICGVALPSAQPPAFP